MFSAKEALKDLKKRTGKNAYMVLNSNLPFDTWRAQLLVQIENTLKPRELDINDYEIHFTVARISPSPLLVALDEDYLNMLEQVGRSKDSECNVYVQELRLSTKVGSPSKSVICFLNFNLQKHGKENDSEGDENSSSSAEEGRKKKKAKKTKVHILPSFTIYILTFPRLPGLPISNPQTFCTTITSKPSEQNGFATRNPAAQVNTASSTPKTAPTFPLAIVILIHGGQQWYALVALLHFSSTNPYL